MCVHPPVRQRFVLRPIEQLGTAKYRDQVQQLLTQSAQLHLLRAINQDALVSLLQLFEFQDLGLGMVGAKQSLQADLTPAPPVVLHL